MIAKTPTYKFKFNLLRAFALAFVILAYYAAIKPTLSIYQENSNAKEKLNEVGRASIVEEDLKDRLRNVQNCIGKDTISRQILGPFLLKVADSLCLEHGTDFDEMQEPQIVEENGFAILTYSIVLSGYYIDLVTFVHDLEKWKNRFKVASVKFYLGKNLFMNDTPKLYCRIYLQAFYETNPKTDTPKSKL